MIQSARLARTLATAFALLAFLLLASGATAHARLETSSIGAGEILPAVPPEANLAFSEAIDPDYSSAVLLFADESEASAVTVALDPASDHTALLTIVSADALPAGSYALVWRVVSSVDGHATTGLIAFSAGTGVAPAIASSSAETANGWLATTGRWLDLISLMAITGAACFFTLAAKGRIKASGLRRSLRQIAVLALPMSVIGIAISLMALIATSTNAAWGSWPGWPESWEIVSGASPGQALLTRLIVIILIAIVLLPGGERWPRWRAAIAAAFGLVGLASFSLTSHAAAGERGSIAIAIDIIHLSAASIWSGGLLLLALSLYWLLSNIGESDRPAIALALTRRFSIVATVALLVVSGSGFLSAAWNVSGPKNLTGETYGQLLLVKVTVVLLIVIVGAVNRLLLVPRLQRTTEAASLVAATGQTRRLQWGAMIEIGMAIAIIILTARLTQIAPANGPLTVDVAARSGPIAVNSTASDLRIAVTGNLANTSDGTIEIAFGNATTGAPVTGLARVIVLATAPNPIDPTGEPLRDRFDATAVSENPGHYMFPRTRLGVEAIWTIEITARRLGIEDAVTTFDLDLQGTAPQPPRLVDDSWRWPRLAWTGWLSIAAAAATVVGGLLLIRRLRGLEPVTAGIMLAVTGLITIGFLLSAYRSGPLQIEGASVVVPGDLNDPGAIQRGSTSWTQACASCHGVDGGGVSEDAPDGTHGHATGPGDLLGSASQSAMTDERYWAISNGIGGTTMPAFNIALTERERWDLVAYLEWLQSQAEDE